MPECVIAAAAARVGKKVLHLDRNGYYGGDWASFSFDKLLEWIEEVKTNTEVNDTEINNEETNRLQRSDFLNQILNEGENVVTCPLRPKSIFNINVKSFIRDAPELPTSVPSESSETPNDSNILVHNDSIENEVLNSNDPEHIDFPEPSTTSETTDGTNPDNNIDSVVASIASSSVSNSIAETREEEQSNTTQQEWTLSSFIENRRKFNIDIAPKIMFSRGSLVDLLISSNIARYAEFQCVNKVLTFINGRIEQVPCSRADVFSTKNVSVVEKRMLMKFLNFCLKFEEQEEEYKGFEDLLFLDFLKSKKLTPNVEHYILHAIAMVNETSNTLQGLKATQKFLQSLGRYGKSPFLCTCYGSGELPQCFCRLCAVYEGLYYLKRSVEGIIFNDNRCQGIISMTQRINCQWLIMESSYAPLTFVSENLPQNLSRALLITDASLSPSERKENILLRLQTCPGVPNPVTVLEFSSKTCVCPEDLFLVHLVCRSSSVSAEEDLRSAVESLFNVSNSDSSSFNNTGCPKILWSLYYNQKDTSTINLNSHVPEGVLLTSSPDLELDYENAIAQAREIFQKICPGEEFLPRAPDPEDILIEMHNNPGDEVEASKIENDVNNSEFASSKEPNSASEPEPSESVTSKSEEEIDFVDDATSKTELESKNISGNDD